MNLFKKIDLRIFLLILRSKYIYQVVSKRLNRKFGISRRIGGALWGGEKDPYHKKNYPPGAHGTLGYRKTTEYGSQLIAKQKLKMYYGDIREKQFKAIYMTAKRRRGDTGENLIGLLESRLDAFLYRSKFAPTVFSSRQFVSHKHVRVNKKIVNIPSYSLRVNDVVELADTVRRSSLILQSIADRNREVPEYINADGSHFKSIFLRMPTLKDVPFPVEMQPNLVIEFYSR